jgi:acyl-CoA thioester hydrolase
MPDRAGPALPVPFRSGPFTVRPEWIDYNGHLNLAYYVLLFDCATDALWAPIGLGDELRATGRATFAAESHILYRAELVEGEAVVIDSQILGLDEKRLHVTHEMRRVRDDMVSAQQELMYLSVDLGTRRVAPWPGAVLALLREAEAAHASLPRPGWVGRRVAMPPARP